MIKIAVDTLWYVPHFLYPCKLCFQYTTLCYTSYMHHTGKKESKNEI